MTDSVLNHDHEYFNSSDRGNVTKGDEMNQYYYVYLISIYYLYPIIVTGRIVHILWYVIGAIGNFVSMLIWANPRMKRVNSSALYLVAVTVCDITYQILHMFSYIKYFWGHPTLSYSGLCEIWNVLYMIPQYASQFFVLGFTVERFISIYKPFRSERFSKRQRVPREISVIVVIVVVISLPQAAFWKIDNQEFCDFTADEVLSEIYNIWSWITEMLIFVLAPVLTLVLNIFIINASKKSFLEHEQSRHGANGRLHIHVHNYHKGKNCRPSTTTLLYISFFRILTQLPVTVTYLIQNIHPFDQLGEIPHSKDSPQDPILKSFIIYWGIRLIIEMIGSSHHALSVFIFYASTKPFRLEVNLLFLKIKTCCLGRKEHVKIYNPSYRYYSSRSSKH